MRLWECGARDPGDLFPKLPEKDSRLDNRSRTVSRPHAFPQYFLHHTMADTTTVHLVSSEGESFDVALSTAKMSELVKTMIDEDADADEAQEIPLPNVKSQILAMVIEFIRHHTSDPMTDIEKVRDRTLL